MAGVSKQIIGSFEDIGKDIVREVASVPKDIAGKALESLGTTSGKTQQASPVVSAPKPPESGPIAQIGLMKDKKAKEAIARAALQQLASRPQGKQPGVWERQQMENQQKKETQNAQKTANAFNSLPAMTSKKRRGNLFGISEKQSSEKGKNARQD